MPTVHLTTDTTYLIKDAIEERIGRTEDYIFQLYTTPDQRKGPDSSAEFRSCLNQLKEYVSVVAILNHQLVAEEH